MPSGGIELDADTVVRAFGDRYFNLLRRGAHDGSLSLSADHWRLQESTSERFRFVAEETAAPDLVLDLDDVERFEWDRLPKQATRSQLRAYLTNGDLWTFSGQVDESALP